MAGKRNKIPLLERLDTPQYDLITLLQVLKGEDNIDSTKIMKIRNMLTPVNGKITESEIETVLYSLGASKMFVDNIIKKTKDYGVRGQ